jgi:L-threonylcarbamoyladenylate synthase
MESTVIGFEGDKAIVYRMGGLTLENLKQYIKNIEVRPYSTSNPQSPGQLSSHYSPRTPLCLGTLEDLLLQHKNKKLAVLSFKDTYQVPIQVTLSPAGDINEAARNLFGALRKLDNSEAELILAEPVPDYGLGRAVNDRLRRASAPFLANT